MEYRIALSYASEDRFFVEYVAVILKRFLGENSVFHYTLGERRMTIEQFFIFINERLSGNPDNVVARMICFVREVGGEKRVVVGQETELFNRDSENRGDDNDRELRTWQSIANSRGAYNLNMKTVSVVLPWHGDLHNPEKQEEWSVPFHITTLGSRGEEYHVTDIDRSSAEHLAELILRDVLSLGRQSHSCKAFTYEKDAIQFYAHLLKLLRTHLSFPEIPDNAMPPFPNVEVDVKTYYEEQFKAGVPLVWPTIRLRTDSSFLENKLVRNGTIGSERLGIKSLLGSEASNASGADGFTNGCGAEHLVVSAALSQYHDSGNEDGCMIRANLCFPEAGPRGRIMSFGDRPPKVGIVVSGGIAPGINAVIDGIVKRHEDYNLRSEVYGFKYGFRALSKDATNMPGDRMRLSANGQRGTNTAEHVSQGGSMLGTFRLGRRLDDSSNKDALKHIISNLEGLDTLYVIGGDGSMKAANLLARELRNRGHAISIVGIPKTMDNDILWVWQSFGFATAVEKAREIINCLSTEVQSNPRICVLQLFGSVSGFVVSHAVLSSQSGQCDVALIPESRFTVEGLAQIFRNKFIHDGDSVRSQLPFGMVVMAETAIPEDRIDYENGAGLTTQEKDALEIHSKGGRYLDGQTSDELRSAGLKLVVHGLHTKLRHYFDEVRIFTNEPRHILRATNPSFSDIIKGQRLGALAVDNAMAGYSDFMVSEWLTEFVLVPLRLVALGRKRIPEAGIFWKSVLAKTGQGNLA